MSAFELPTTGRPFVAASMTWLPVRRFFRPSKLFASVDESPLMNVSWNLYEIALTFIAVCVARWSLRLERVCWMKRSTSASPPNIASVSLFWLTVPVDSE